MVRAGKIDLQIFSRIELPLFREPCHFLFVRQWLKFCDNIHESPHFP